MRARFFVIVLALFGVVSGYFFGKSYIGRLPDYRGFFIVHVEDHVGVPPPPRPRRTVFILVDGLRRDTAETMASTRRLAARGQCRISDQGSYTVSRPVYALLSTGLEADRTGARNNDLTAPLPRESVWELVRKAGLRVRGSSHLPWFKQLFPLGFDVYRHTPLHEANVFAPSTTDDAFDVDLYHPLYVDEAGHDHGGISPAYAAAAARADTEITALLDTLDLDRDVVILTADHGHRAEGGHGGSQPEIRNVLACFAGPHIQHREDRLPFDGRVTGPLISVLLGLPFPANMRAGDDGLDVLWEIVRFDDAYTKDRRDAVEHARQTNAAALEAWLGDKPGTWPRLYAREGMKQLGRGAIIAAAAAIMLALRLRKRSAKERMRGLGWLAGTLFMLWLAHHALLGDFDYTVINREARFVRLALKTVALTALGAIALHYGLERRSAGLTSSLVTLLLFLLLVNLGHVFVYGWPLGFPLPSDAARYWPFFGAIAQVGFALLTAASLVLDRKPREPSH